MVNVLENWHQQYLVLDFDHAFLANTIAEELILYDVADSGKVKSKIATMFRNFKKDYEDSRSVNELSGGEKAILVCIVYAVLIEIKNKKANLLLCNILESLSQNNRDKLIKLLKEICADRAEIYQLVNEEPILIS